MKDKEKYSYFKIDNAKEVSDKDLKKLKKIHKGIKGTMTELNKKDNMIKEEV